MEIRKVTADKRKFLLLLLLADEEERMIDRYLDRGEMYVLDDGGVKSECVVTDEGGVFSKSRTWPPFRPSKAKATRAR